MRTLVRLMALDGFSPEIHPCVHMTISAQRDIASLFYDVTVSYRFAT